MVTAGKENLRGSTDFVDWTRHKDVITGSLLDPYKRGAIGESHNHINAGSGRSYGSTHAPSDEDKSFSKDSFKDNIYYDIVVTPKFIYLINSNTGLNIATDRNGTFNKDSQANKYNLDHQKAKQNGTVNKLDNSKNPWNL